MRAPGRWVKISGECAVEEEATVCPSVGVEQLLYSSTASWGAVRYCDYAPSSSSNHQLQPTLPALLFCYSLRLYDALR
eukprot:scaffold134_cov111-Isochrysis_galbana.AAC.8